MTDLNKLAKEVIDKNQYLALSTINEKGKPWSCILAYTFDDNYNFYFVSLPSSNHSRHIDNNSEVTFAIYDSTQGFGLGTGLQVEATAKKLDPERTAKITEVYFGRNYPYGNISNDFTAGLKKLLANKTYNVYQLTPTHVWINDPNADTDRRVEVSLK